MEELYALEPDALVALAPIYGLIFLFRWQREEDGRPVDADAEGRGVFFASQVGGRVWMGGWEGGRPGARREGGGPPALGGCLPA